MLIGIDPGASGAVAWLSDDGHLVCVEDLPVVEMLIGGTKRRRMAATVLRQMLIARRPVHAFLEEVHAMGKNGAIANFQLGNCSGLIEGVLAGLAIPLTPVKPSQWQKHFGRGADKGASRAHAMRLWPGAADRFARVKDDGRAEAALIALYGAQRAQGFGKVDA